MKTILIILIGLLFCFFILLHFVIPYKFLKPIQKTIPESVPENGIRYEKVKVDIDKENYLVGFHVHPGVISSKNDTILLILHGISGAKEKFLSVSNYLSKEGYTSFVFDQRLHGESTGTYFTYGAEEKQDVSKMIDLIKQINPNATVGILGHSMGGAIASQALAYDPRIEFGIIQSSFRSLSEIVHDYSDRIGNGLAPNWCVDYILKRTGQIANFDAFSISPLESLKKVTVPLLISHGDLDDKIKYQYGKDLFESSGSAHKKFYTIKNGKHEGVLAVGGETYFAEVVTFIETLPK